LNSHGLSPTTPSRWRVCLFHHLGPTLRRSLISEGIQINLSLAGAAGLEPATCGFGDRCSSQTELRPSISVIISKIPLGRLERPTRGLGNRCSIHLSYRGTLLPQSSLWYNLCQIPGCYVNQNLNALHFKTLVPIYLPKGIPSNLYGGDRGIRTPDPCDANAVLSQLSYIPESNFSNTPSWGQFVRSLPSPHDTAILSQSYAL
jgi:hypothetical protein